MDLNTTFVSISKLSNSSQKPEYPNLSTYIFKGFLITPICVFGILGNFVSFIVLRKPKMKSSITLTLMALAVADSVFLVTQLLINGVNYLMQFFTQGMKIGMNYSVGSHPVLLYFSVVGETASIYFTIVIAINRFIAVCKPFQSLRYLTFHRNLLSIVAVAVFSLIFALPKFLVYIFPELAIKKAFAAEAPSAAYRFMDAYETWIKTCFQLLIPLVISTALNIKICKKVRSASKRRKRIASTSSSSSDGAAPAKTVEGSITEMLIATFCVYGVCYLSKLICAILSLFRATVISQTVDFESSEEQNNSTLLYTTTSRPMTISYFCYFDGICNSIVEVLPSFNSAVNFIVYFWTGKQFRQTCIEIIKGGFSWTCQRS